MVVVDVEKCAGCGTCVKICHEHCMSLVDKKVSIDYRACSTCTQCIAICAEKALSWDGAEPIDFDPSLLPSVTQVEELFAERRTVRTFTSDPVDRKLIQDIVSWGAYAPTHNHNLRCFAIDDLNVIEAFDKASFRFSKWIYGLLFHPRPIRWLLSIAPRVIQEEFNKALPKLETVIGRGSGYASLPPVLICIVGDRRTPLSLESAQYGLHNIALMAQVKGLGCRSLVGNQMIFNRDKNVRRLLGLKRSQKIFAVAGFGYPAVRFRNKVLGKSMSVRWISSGGSENVQ